MVLDGAYEFINRCGLKIDIVLGDFDSIDPLLLPKSFDASGNMIEAVAGVNGVSFVHTPDQDQTDLQKGLHYLNALSADYIVICNALGQRLDHTLFNLRMLKQFYQPGRPIRLMTETETIYYLENTKTTIDGRKRDGFAILGFPSAVVSTSGLKYELNDLVLEFEKQSSVCNELVAEQVKVTINGHALIIHQND